MISVTTVRTKRKAADTLESCRAKSARQPLRTLDAFFAPQRTAHHVGVIQDKVKKAKPEVTRSEDYDKLSEEQKRVLKMVVDGEKSLFFTGSAG